MKSYKGMGLHQVQHTINDDLDKHANTRIRISIFAMH